MNSKIKILLVVLAGLCAVALVIAFQLNTVNKTLRSEFDQKQQEFTQKEDGLNRQLASVVDTKKKLDKELIDLQAQFKGIADERDDYRGKFEKMSNEHGNLASKVDELSQKNKELEDALQKAQSSPSIASAPAPSSAPSADDSYWASVLKDKAALEIETKNLRAQVSDLTLKAEKAMTEGRKLDLQLRTISEERNDLSRKVIYNEKLSETLSEDLVREKRDKKSIIVQLENLRSDNFELKSRLMALGDKKVSLETKVVDLQQEREVLSKRLSELDNILQDRVDQIIQVKDDLKVARVEAQATQAKDAKIVQLQPIVVKAQEEPVKKASGTGQVLAINEDNNFVIIDIGEDKGSRVGQSFNLYRNNMKIATVEVIQTRKEISAADIKNVTSGSKIKVGDSVS